MNWRLLTASRYCLASWRVLLKRGAVSSLGDNGWWLLLGIGSHLVMRERAVSISSSMMVSEKDLPGGEGGNDDVSKGGGECLKKMFLNPLLGIF